MNTRQVSISQHPGNIYSNLVLYKVSLLHVLDFKEHQASVPQHPGNIYVSLVFCKVGFSPSYGSLSVFCKKRINQLYHSIREIITVILFLNVSLILLLNFE